MLRSADLDEAIAGTQAAIAARPELKMNPAAAPFCLRFLFFQVIQRLAKPQVKTFTSAECSEALTKSLAESLSAAHSDLSDIFLRIGETANSFEIIISNLKRTALAEVEGSEWLLEGRLGVSHGRPRLLLNPPALVEPRAPREKLVRNSLSQLRKGKCVALVGEKGVGKTQLARMIADEFSVILWAGLRVNSDFDASVVLETAVREFKDRKANRIFVVDDADVGAVSDAFMERMRSVIDAAKEMGFSLLVTTSASLPISLSHSFHRVKVGDYLEEDIQFLLTAHGCPANLNTNWLRGLIMGTTSSHPLLIAALIRFLADRKWSFDDEALHGVLSKSFAQDVRLEMQRRLLATQDELTREFLYRLSLIDFNFTQTQALQLAGIEPEVPRANEKLTVLSGIWLQQNSEDSFTGSPLISGVGDANLSAAVKKRVHARVARWILDRKSLDQAQTVLAISHLIGSEEHSLAGVVLLKVLQAALKVYASPDGIPVLQAWIDLPLPSQMGISVRLLIRGLQIAIVARAGENADFLEQDLKMLIGEANDDIGRCAAIAACSYAATIS